MEEKRINTIVTEESIVESLHKQLDNNEFSMLEKALKAFGQSKSDVSDIDILIDCTSEELQSVNYCELTEKFSKLTIPIKQEVESDLKVHTALQRNSIRFQRKYS